MFFGRDAELGKLNDMWDSGRFEFAVVFGRRRVGKTALIREFIKGKRAIFFAASETTAADNLLSLSRAIGGGMDTRVYPDYEAALAGLFGMAESERLAFVIDEFPYLAESHRGISSQLQILIDHRKDSSKLMLILCGSSMSFMESQVLGHKSPLYGRRTAQFRMLPFTFFEALPFLSGFDPIAQAELYGVTGGIPEYLCKIDSRKTVRGNITDLFLDTSGHFFEEPSNLIKQELREPSTYNVIIEAIAHGATRLNDIATKSNIESNKCAKYLVSLIALGLVRKEYPLGEKSGRRTIYRLEDMMFRFWYKFVFPNISAVTAGLGASVYTHEVKPQFNAYMGLVFEDICKQWLYECVKRGKLPFISGGFGRWWGPNPKTRTQEEIDIMALHGGSALFAECKWTNAAVDPGVYANLVRKGDMFGCGENRYFLFAKSAFRKDTSAYGDATCLTLAEMMKEAKVAKKRG